MSSTLLRLGLWVLVLVLGLYVLAESSEESPIRDFVPMEMLQKALGIGALLIVAGIILRMFEKTASKVLKNRCSVCRTPIPTGAIYCRAHLRNVLHEEEDKLHRTRWK